MKTGDIVRYISTMKFGSSNIRMAIRIGKVQANEWKHEERKKMKKTMQTKKDRSTIHLRTVWIWATCGEPWQNGLRYVTFQWSLNFFRLDLNFFKKAITIKRRRNNWSKSLLCVRERFNMLIRGIRILAIWALRKHWYPTKNVFINKRNLWSAVQEMKRNQVASPAIC